MMNLRFVYLLASTLLFYSCASSLTKKDVEFRDGIIWTYNGTDKNIKIPEYFEDEKVIGIGPKAFFHHQLKEVSLPNSILVIGEGAFAENSISKLKLSNKLVYIDEAAFSKNKLKTLSIPKSVRRINYDAFYDNPLEDVTITDKLKVIEYLAFPKGTAFKFTVLRGENETVNLSDIFVDEEFMEVPDKFDMNKGYYNYRLYDTLKLEDIVFENGTIKSYQPPKNILNLEKIIAHVRGNGDNRMPIISFVFCEGESYIYQKTNRYLKNLAPSFIFGMFIPDEFNGQAVTSISEGVFARCNIINLKLPKDIKEIGKAAFANNLIININIPKGLTQIDDYVFMENKLRKLNLPNTVLNIHKSCFASNLISQLTLPSHLSILPPYCFANNKIEHLNIPTETDSIMEGAFSSNNIGEINFNNKLIYIGEESFGGNDLTSLSFPNKLTHIGESSFLANALSKIYFPLNAVNIGAYAFRSQDEGRSHLDSVVVAKGSKIHEYSFEKTTHISFK